MKNDGKSKAEGQVTQIDETRIRNHLGEMAGDVIHCVPTLEA